MLKIKLQASVWRVKELHYQLRTTDNPASAANDQENKYLAST